MQDEKTEKTEVLEVSVGEGLCQCRQCLRDRKEEAMGIPKEFTVMILCPWCGNKRCPHATDHRLACTNSNDPGQKGSAYE